ncbi:hypothetical protein F5Y10DRAFT_264518 [Nemania abortiva]|nr:hypothetical protein F5Y10DRAFT_264518 [Nemania abortiva]
MPSGNPQGRYERAGPGRDLALASGDLGGVKGSHSPSCLLYLLAYTAVTGFGSFGLTLLLDGTVCGAWFALVASAIIGYASLALARKDRTQNMDSGMDGDDDKCIFISYGVYSGHLSHRFFFSVVAS